MPHCDGIQAGATAPPTEEKTLSARDLNNHQTSRKFGISHDRVVMLFLIFRRSNETSTPRRSTQVRFTYNRPSVTP